MEAANAAVEKTDDAPAPGSLSYVTVDLGDLDTVKPCVDGIVEKTQKVDFLVCNAGVMRTPYQKTKQNLEMQIGKVMLV